MSRDIFQKSEQSAPKPAGQAGQKGSFLTLALFAALAVAGTFAHLGLCPEPPSKGIGWGHAGANGAEVSP